ncbi:hypothetical protein AFL01nite_00360 [Aeromicrobium flavum]|uniref:Uncharacterized protein n=1 Tax=Aeromicrobium flavum TaxID=416568 RepID=A0A512HQJ0_9ACTN|nr:hypothetical protein [Aeromicrobium flavum]GEO87709.1 hypothetical protein AFL01nite_00360 [Aeromicrobium flavum]
MIVDVWMQHPTERFSQHDMFASLRRWTNADESAAVPGIDMTIAAMDAGGVDFGLLSAWSRPTTLH